MKQVDDAALSPQGYVLPEEGHEQLTKLRDQIFLVAKFVFANTLEEDQEPLEITRSMLGQLLENYGLRIDDVLNRMERSGRCLPAPRQQH